MKNFVYSVWCLFCTFIIFSGFNYAQNSLTHNTGSLQITVIDNGYIGDDASGAYGGVVFNGNVNAMFTAGFIAGLASTRTASGMIGSFQSGGVPVIQDLINTVPISGFYSDLYFDQISYYYFEVIGNPDYDNRAVVKSNTGQDFVFLRVETVNNSLDSSDWYFGIFADWDIGGDPNYLLNRGGYDPDRNMLYQYENGGAGDANYYGILLINEDPNTVMGTVDKDIVFTTTEQLRLDIFDLMISTTFDTITADGDYRTYLSSGPYTWLPGQTLVLDYAFVAGTSLTDLQNNAEDAIAYGPFVPVELTSFAASTSNGKVTLNWTTATEINNLGFEIERKIINDTEGEWVRIGFKEGYGTTTKPKEYSFEDDISDVNATSMLYRLKQIDFDGSYEYSEEVLVETLAPVNFVLEQNYPNPFNPATTIEFALPIPGFVTLSIFNLLGELIVTLVSENFTAGSYKYEWNASELTSGIYFYQLQTEGYIETKKMLLLK